MNIVLIGYRGSGKTTVGLALAAAMKAPFVDVDEFIEKLTQLSVAEIFGKGGESYFRDLESQAVDLIAKRDGWVVATGGGAILRLKNVQTLKRGGRIVWLRVEPETALARIQADKSSATRRPPLTADDPEGEVRGQIERRAPYYEAAADFTVDTDGRAKEEIVKAILHFLKDT